MPTDSDQLALHFGFSFEDLYRRDGLVRLDGTFLQELQSADVALFDRLTAARTDAAALTRKQQSDLIIDLAPHLEDFIGELFGITADVRKLQGRHDALAPIYALKRKFIQKKAISGVTKEQATAINGTAVAAELESLFGEPLTERSFVEHVSPGSMPSRITSHIFSQPRNMQPGPRSRLPGSRSTTTECFSASRTSWT